MKEHPILFSTPMVQAILEGRKTQTRRIMKPQPVLHNDVIKLPIGLEAHSAELKAWKKKGYTHIGNKAPMEGYLFRPIKKEVGDQLWVRETWCEWEFGKKYGYKADGFIERYGAWERDMTNSFHDVERVEKWKPSLFMPREASRIQLELSDIRAERIQDISEEDALAEGVAFKDYPGGRYYQTYGEDEIFDEASARDSFEMLWASINNYDTWEFNYWVWVYEFKRIDN